MTERILDDLKRRGNMTIQKEFEGQDPNAKKDDEFFDEESQEIESTDEEEDPAVITANTLYPRNLIYFI